MKKKCMLMLSLLLAFSTGALPQEKYSASEGWIVGHNMGRYNNRPIYLDNSKAFILTGDEPLFRFVMGNKVYGTLVLTYVHGKVRKPLFAFGDITSSYRAGQMEWVLKDNLNPRLTLRVDLLKWQKGRGAEMCIVANGAAGGDYLKWEWSAPKRYEGRSLSWDFDVLGHPSLMKWGLDEDFTVQKGDSSSLGTARYLTLSMDDKEGLVVVQNQGGNFASALAVASDFRKRMVIDTPDKWLNAVAGASLAAVDGTWYPPVFVHGCMQWNMRLPGWRTMFGGIMYGWHERIADEAKFYIKSQVTQSDKRVAKADSSLLLTSQDHSSRFFGVGRLQEDQNFYDMQSQFFDQLVEEYRWNSTPEFVRLLRPALELHLTWMDECFDPDGDGLYESYINTWPTDSQWYNGGGTAEETSYAYRGHSAALDMALAAGDTAAASGHRAKLERIRKGFFNRLWLNEVGHSGAYREQGGYERIHKDPWLYSIFLPIDAGLTTDLQGVESLYYPEYALQNDTIPGAGRMVWTSNWVPGIWSVRELWPGDNYHLALAYFQSGMAEEGWQIMKGTFMHTAFRHSVPGDLGSDQGGIDFGDCVHPFARTLVSGLFGYRPNYPKGQVEIAPSFPNGWKRASIVLPDFSIRFNDQKGNIHLEVELRRSAIMKMHIPVSCSRVVSVRLNGKAVTYQCLPAMGKSMVVVETPNAQKATVDVTYDERLDPALPTMLNCEVGSRQMVAWSGIRVLSVFDPQGVLRNATTASGRADFSVAGKAGHHTVFVKVCTKGGCEQWRILHLNITDSVAMQAETAMTPSAALLKTFVWRPVDIGRQMNADVRTIFKQKYLSPRPNTVSVRLGTDGYSPWTFPFWHSGVPEIALDSVARYLTDGNLVTPQGVHFRWNDMERNVAFVSLWDNYPHELTFDAGQAEGAVLSLLVCGSTNVMQCHIANAALYIHYTDGVTDSIALVPPVNYWNLSPIIPHATATGQNSRTYYTSSTDRWCMPKVMPQTVSLGKNCTAMLISRRLLAGKKVRDVTLRCLSEEVVVGLMGLSVGN